MGRKFPFPRSRRARLLLAVVPLVLLLIAATPPVRAGAKGALLVLDVLPGPSPLALVTPNPNRTELELPSTQADLYRPRGFTEPPGIVLLHGANPQGKDDSRVIDLASGLARTGRTVLVPNLGLRHERIDPRDPDRIVEAVERLAERGDVSVLAFSYGAGLGLVALADEPRLQERVRVFATVGTYYDMTHLLMGATTERVPFGDDLVEWEPHPEAQERLVEQMAFLVGGTEGRALERAWDQRDPEGLDPETRAAYELLRNRDPERVRELVRSLREDLQELLVDLSPSQVVDRIRFPVYALHDQSDPAAPITESRMLVAELRERGIDARLSEVDFFDHVFPVVGPLGNVGDARRLTTFAGSVLRAQEGWPRL